MSFINVGYGNIVNTEKVISVISYEAAPIKRMVQTAKDAALAIDATCGKKTKAVLVMENQMIVLSSLLPDTITNRLNNNS